jgi:haloalkane dehalogenase
VLKSRVDDLTALLKHRGVEKDVTLVVHDWGGMIGLAWALKRPERVKRLVILNTFAFQVPREKRLPWQLWVIRHIPLLSDIAVRGFNGFAVIAASYGVEKKLDPDVRAAMLSPYDSWKNRISTLRFVQDIPLGPDDPSFSLVEKVDRGLKRLRNIPMLICWGEKDLVFDDTVLKEWRKRFPKAEIRAYDDANHFVLLDKPEEIKKEMRRFFQKNPIGTEKEASDGKGK